MRIDPAVARVGKTALKVNAILPVEALSPIEEAPTAERLRSRPR